MRRFYTFIYICLNILLVACSDDDNCQYENSSQMRFVAIHPSALSRVGNSAFEVNDRIGVFVTEDSVELQIAGNKVHNEALTFDGSQWNTRRQLYWDDGVYNVYAYYPHLRSISSIEDCTVSVSTDQSLETIGLSLITNTSISAYEASDILFAKTESVTASDEAVPLRFAHIMSRLVIRLVKGEDYEGELPASVDVFVHNTVTDATLNLKNGIVTKSIKAGRQTIKARQESIYTYAAIIVPQRIPDRLPLIEVSINDVSYIYEGTFVFKPGTQHVVNFVLDKNPNQSLMSIGGEVNNW